MAYTKELYRRCPCGKVATVGVYNWRNAHLGDRCRRCATQLVAKLQREEEEDK